MASTNARRPRRTVFCLFAFVICAGLASRRYPWFFPQFLLDYPGNVFWAMAAYLGLVLARPAIGVPEAAAGALAISFGVEFSQLYHADWIDGIRRTLFGRLILGSGFDWLDLAAYGAGVLIVSVADAGFVIQITAKEERVKK